MIIFVSVLTAFETSNIFGGIWVSSKDWLKPKIKPSNQGKLILVPDIEFLLKNYEMSE